MWDNMPVYSVSEANRYIRYTLESQAILQDIWIRGEVSNLSASAAGHFYFTIKDLTNQIRCVMFRPALGHEHLSNGAAVLSHGRISIYEIRGELQLYADLVQPEGIGESIVEMEELKTKLSGEGLFSESRKRPLPSFPKKIAVITSPYGSVWHDIQNVIGRRYPVAELILVETLVQGDEAATRIINSFNELNLKNDIDLIILARGGGSTEELQPFNEESVARAIYSSRSPVISAVGHETDYTIADMVADHRAPTPSSAAELAVPDILEIRGRIESNLHYSFSLIGQLIVGFRHGLNQAMSTLQRQYPNTSLWRQKTDELSQKQKNSLQNQFAIIKERLKAYELQLKSLSPYDVLERGYGFVEQINPPVPVSSVNDVQVGDDITITVKDGSFSSKVY